VAAQGPSAVPVVPQSSGGAQQDLPGPPVDLPRVDDLQETVLWAYAVQYAEELQVFLFSWLKGGANMILSFLGIILGVVMVPIYLYYFLRESAAIKDSWHIYVPLRASRFKDEVVGTVAEINGYLLSFFRGQMLVAFIDGILIGIALTIFRLPLGLPIGILVCFLGIIPYIGSIICLIPACVLAYFHFGVTEHQHVLGANPWSYVGGVVVIFIVVNQVNSLVTSPRIVGSSVGLHPMTVIFSMLFWTLLLGGFLGALLAVPLTAAVKVLIRRYIWERKLNNPDQPDGPEGPRGNGGSGLIFESSGSINR
jgi:predicted PurR-regulated permease PerM